MSAQFCLRTNGTLYAVQLDTPQIPSSITALSERIGTTNADLDTSWLLLNGYAVFFMQVRALSAPRAPSQPTVRDGSLPPPRRAALPRTASRFPGGGSSLTVPCRQRWRG